MAFCDLEGDLDTWSHGEIHHQHRAGKCPRRWSSSTISWTRACWNGCSVASSDFARVTYTEAVDMLIKSDKQVRLPRILGHHLTRPSMSAISPRRFQKRPSS